MPVAQTRLEILQVHKFLQCVRSKDKAQIEKLCSNGVPHLVNYSEPEEGETGLHLAARVNDEEMVRFLLDLGAHPNVIDLKGRTAAMRAAEFGHVQTLEILATAGSDMKIKDTDGKGILFFCILPTSRHARCTAIVIENGAECNNTSNDGMPLLVVACLEAKENEDICKKLLDQGADPNSTHPSTGRTALNAAAGSGSVEVVKAILSKGGNVNTPDKNMLTPTHRASMRGHFEVLQILASYDADFGCVDVILNTPVHYAAEGGHALCCRYLAQRGAKAHMKNEDGLLPKVIAKNFGFKDALKECKKAEKLAKKIQTGGKLPTEPWAVRVYDWANARQDELSKKFMEMDPEMNEVISKDQFYDVLISFDAPVNEEDFKKLFQLHDKMKENVINYSDFLGAKKYVHKTYLMSAYAKKDKKKKGKKGKKKKGKTKVPMPICLGPEGDRTERGGPPPVFIERHVPFTDTGRFDRNRPPLHPIQDDSAWYLSHPEKTYINVNDAAKMGDLDSLRQAFIHGRSVDVRDKYFKTALMIACGQGNFDIAKFLVDNGAQVNTCDNFKWTPLHHACLAGQLDIVQRLVEAGADMNAQALNGGTPLMRAIQTGSPNIVQYLINSGCSLQLENRKGDTAMDVARWWADPRVLQIVSDKFETIPTPKEGKGKKGKKSAGKKSDGVKRAQSVPPIPQGGLISQPSGTDSPITTPRERKGSVLRAASAMAGGIEHQEDITYIPLKAWSNVPNTMELIIKKEQRRQRYGDGIDFPDYRHPFNENFMKKSEELGGVDSDDD